METKPITMDEATAVTFLQKCIETLTDTAGLKMSLKVRTAITEADSYARIAQTALRRALPTEPAKDGKPLIDIIK